MSDVPGWGDFGDAYYPGVVASAPAGATLVEVGVYHGRSLIPLARHALDAGKGLRVVGIDHFRGSEEHRRKNELPACGNTAGECVKTLAEAGVADAVTLLVTGSRAAAGWFADGSVWFVFLDAGHDAASVLADLRAWWPKVAPGGRIGGHDYEPAWPWVVAVVDAFAFGAGLAVAKPVETETVWEVRKPYPEGSE